MIDGVKIKKLKVMCDERGRLGHDRRYSIDCTKIENEFGWKPQYDFDEALEKTVNWYINNEEWWRPLKGDITRK